MDKKVKRICNPTKSKTNTISVTTWQSSELPFPNPPETSRVNMFGTASLGGGKSVPSYPKSGFAYITAIGLKKSSEDDVKSGRVIDSDGMIPVTETHTIIKYYESSTTNVNDHDTTDHTTFLDDDEKSSIQQHLQRLEKKRISDLGEYAETGKNYRSNEFTEWDDGALTRLQLENYVTSAAAVPGPVTKKIQNVQLLDNDLELYKVSEVLP